MSKFANYIQQFGAGLDTVVASAESGTIFAPNNEAFDKLSQSELEILLGKDGRRIMGLHFVDQLIPAEDVRILQPQNDIKVFTCFKTRDSAVGKNNREADGPLEIEPDPITIVLLNKEPDPIKIILLNKEPDQIII